MSSNQNKRKAAKKQPQQQRKAGAQGKKKGPKQEPTRRKSRRKTALQNVNDRVSECAATFAFAINDPWSQRALLSCVPVPAGNTQSVTGFIRGTFKVGMGGTGFVAMHTCIAADMPFLFATDDTYASTAVSYLLSPGVPRPGLNMIPMVGLPYGLGDLTQGFDAPKVTGRVVASALKCAYVGPVALLSGQAYCFRDPEHSTIQYFQNGGTPTLAGESYYGARRECAVNTLDHAPREISDFAWSDTELNMSSNALHVRFRNDNASNTAVTYPYSNGNANVLCDDGSISAIAVTGVNIGIPTAIIMVTGAPVGTAISFTAILHAEYGGPKTASLAKPTVADVQGANRVLAASNAAATVAQSPDTPPLMERFMTAFETLASVGNVSMRAAAAVGRAARVYRNSPLVQRGALAFAS